MNIQNNSTTLVFAQGLANSINTNWNVGEMVTAMRHVHYSPNCKGIWTANATRNVKYMTWEEIETNPRAVAYIPALFADRIQEVIHTEEKRIKKLFQRLLMDGMATDGRLTAVVEYITFRDIKKIRAAEGDWLWIYGISKGNGQILVVGGNKSLWQFSLEQKDWFMPICDGQNEVFYKPRRNRRAA